MEEFELKIFIDANNEEEAEEIAHDLHEILNDNNVINTVLLVDEEE